MVDHQCRSIWGRRKARNVAKRGDIGVSGQHVIPNVLTNLRSVDLIFGNNCHQLPFRVTNSGVSNVHVLGRIDGSPLPGIRQEVSDRLVRNLLV